MSLIPVMYLLVRFSQITVFNMSNMLNLTEHMSLLLDSLLHLAHFSVLGKMMGEFSKTTSLLGVLGLPLVQYWNVLPYKAFSFFLNHLDSDM